LPEGDPRRQDLGVVVSQIDRISGIIRSLLDMVRAQKPEIQPAPVAAVLDRLLPLVEHAARRRRLTLSVSLPADLPPMQADPNQFQQVLLNLLMNALEATSEGGKVQIGAARAQEGGRPGVAVTVSDTGPGIPADLLPRLFEPFFTTKPPGQGTGLGLAICRDIVRDHGGEIRVESSPGRGTAFTVWLPEAAGSAQ
ncbi:MAG: histidine kinase, partial [Candidatus Rokubacteria bacterium]|nr:histidine kinase [Candidatus Rokubacteria bacterium]